MKPLIAVAALALLTLQTQAQQQPAPITRPAEVAPPAQQAPAPDSMVLHSHDEEHPSDLVTTARAVLLDVLVVDSHGQPVKGLPASDFQVTEDGAPQTIDSFHEHTSADSAAISAAMNQIHLPQNSFTNYLPTGTGNSLTVILLDAANTPLSAQSFARSQIIAYMKTIPAGNPVAIFQLDTSMHLIQGFSSDPRVLLEAVESKRDGIRMTPIPIHGGNYVTGRVRQDILDSGLRNMAAYLAGFPGRKNLVWFTGSIPRAFWDGDSYASPFADTEDIDAELSSATDVLALSRVAVYPVDARGLEGNPAFSAANRNMPSLSSLNNFTTRRFYDHSDMDDVAEKTGGKAFYNTNGLKQALTEVVDTSSNYYTIAYTPSNKNWDGRYRNIRINVPLEGVHLEYRRGYTARQETPAQHRRALNKAAAARALQGPSQSAYNQGALVSAGPRGNFDSAMDLGAIPPTEIVFNTSVTPGTSTQKIEKNAPLPKGNYLRPDVRYKPYRDYHVLYAVAPRTLRFSPNPDGSRDANLQFVVALYDDKGEIVNSASDTFNMRVTAAEYDQLMHTGLGTRQTIAVPAKGTYFLRFGVHDLTTNKIGAMEVPVDNVQLGVAGAGQTLTP